ncbi:MAG: acyl-CoA thioester hydrolase [Verrucomicrobiota bacterium]|nr:acyl-CoA thioester hydrolase [Verrucomicrobiota bacterium]
MPRPSFTLTRRVEFHETDAAGLMHFSNFYRWMEVCEHEWFRTLGLEIMSDGTAGHRRGWPRRDSSCTHLRPLRCGDLVRIRATLEEVSDSSLAYGFIFEKDRAGRWTEVARGRMTTVHVRQDRAGRMESEPMPPTVRAAFAPTS